MVSPRSVFRFIGRSGRRLAVSIAGFVVLATGLVMMVTPGPGLLLIIVGLAILGTEYEWAKRLLEKTREQARRARERIRQRRGRAGPPAE